MNYELRNVLRARWLYLYAAMFFATSALAVAFSEGTERTLLVLAHVSLLVIPLISAVAAANSTYGRRAYDEFLLTQPVSRASVYFAAVFALVIAFAASVVVPVAMVVVPAGLPLRETLLVLSANFGLSSVSVLAGIVVATWVEDRARGLGTLLVVWFVGALVYDALLLYAIVLFEEYPMEPLLEVAVLLNPIDAVRLLLYQDLGLRFLLPVAVPGAAVWVSLFLWSSLLLVVGFQVFARKDF
ncbi:MAG: hypothetical protein KatS3mg077_2758 [Candidatus Binatia bacterium]|nr:MAG: hypothetical protein KatS3mg077_2758 [Candidatus Binatia bacterium]